MFNLLIEISSAYMESYNNEQIKINFNDDYFPFNLMETKKFSDTTDNVVKQTPYPEELKEIIKNEKFEDELGTLFKVIVNGERIALINIPSCIQNEIKLENNKNKNKKYPLVLFFHGLGGWAWTYALQNTNWRSCSNNNKFYLIFAQGTDCNNHYDKRNGFNTKSPQNELLYVLDLITTMTNRYNIDLDQIFYVGYSNGAIFSSHVAQTFGGSKFAGISNTMGGFGFNHREVFKYESPYPCPLIIISGTHGDYLSSCTEAYEYFKFKNFDVEFNILEGRKHAYPTDLFIEEDIWKFFMRKSILK